MVEFYVESNTTTIPLGRQGENLARTIYFELSELISNYGEGTATLVYLRSRDSAPYVCDTTQSGSMLSWTPTDTDTAYAGAGKCELRWVVGETLAKSIVYRTSVTESITGDSTVPSEYESWYEALLEHISEYEIASDQIAANASQIAANTSDIAVLDGRMDEFTTLTDGSTTGDAELADIRVGYDGTVYSNAGEAVRTQVNDAKKELSEDTGNVVETLSASVDVRGVTVESLKPGFINLTGTATSGGGRTVPITKIVTLEPGTYTLTSNTDLPSTLSVMAESHMVNTILATINSTTKSATFTLTSATDVYVGVNVTNETTYNIVNLLLQIKAGTTATDVFPKITAMDYIARKGIEELETETALIDDLSVGAYVSLKQRFPFIIGGLTQSGGTSNTKNRLVSAERYSADKDVYIDMPTGYKYAIFSFVGDVATDSGWLTGIHTITKNTTFRLQLARVTENPSEVITNVETCDLYINLTFKPDTEGNYLNGIQCLSVSKMTVANPWTQGACKVGRKIVGFNASKSDHTTNAMYRVYDLDDNLTVLGGAGHNLGHCATSDYCNTTDTLLVANGTDEPGISPAIYLIKQASAKISALSDISVTNADVVEIPFASISGEGTGACFGENDDIIYIITLENSAQYDVYDTKYVYRILLGKGDTDLTAIYTTNSFGTFIAGCDANEYNGTAYILDSHEIQMYGELQGLKYRNGYLFMSTDTPTILGTRTAYVAKIKVSDNVSVEKFYQILTLSASGGLVSCEGEGIVLDGIDGYISTFVSGTGAIYKFNTII